MQAQMVVAGAEQQVTSASARLDCNRRAQPLGRRLSAPARLKPVRCDEHCNIKTSEPNTSGASSVTTTPRLEQRAAYCKKCHSYRRVGSLRERRARNYKHNQDHRTHPLHQYQSASPLLSSSSSASRDSALSQSQTTLGADSERCSFTTSSSSTSGNSKNCNKDAGDDECEKHCEGQDSDHFKIIWQNFSYKVPEKKFCKLVQSVTRIPELWSQKANKTNCDALESAKTNNAPSNSDNITSEDNRYDLEDGSQSASSCLQSSSNKQRKVIFSNLNGCVKSGQLTAILGPSGAGKTTFLKCLTSDVVEGVSGSINIVGGPKTSQHLKLCIIPQKDYLFDNLTVMENLLFASRIKNTRQDFNHTENVYRVAALLGLHACLKLKTSRLSGGQYKRVSIAQELLSQPDILILDEPTSGLDSRTCFRTVSVLKELVDMSRKGLMAPLAIVMTIHQPQIKIFNLFHHVYILSSMGQCVYEGKPDYLLDTIAEQCKLLPPPDDQNPASFIIDLASEVYGQQPIDKLSQLQLDNFNLAHARSSSSSPSAAVFKHVSNKLDETNNNNNLDKCRQQQQLALFSSENRAAQSASKTTPYSRSEADELPLYISERLRKRYNHEQSFWLHTSLLIKRLWISMWRDSLLTTTRVIFHVIIPFVFYFVYSQKSGIANACPHVERELDIQDMVSDTNIQRLATQHDELILTFENVSLFFLLLYSFSMCVLAVTALSFPLNMQILLKETGNGWYTMPRFVMAKTLADLPIELTMPMISISIAYAITGQPSSYLCWRMLAVTAVMTLCSLISQTQGLLFGAFFMNNVQAAVFVSQASTLPWIMLSGFTTRVSELPRLLQWLSFGSIYRLGIESIVAVRYGFGMCPCQEELVNNTPPKMVGIPEQLRSVMRYYMDSYDASNEATSEASNSTANTATIMASNQTHVNQLTSSNGDIFEKIATTLSRANTYGVDIGSCADVKPFIMSAREVDESTLVNFLVILLTILIGLKVLLFFVVRIRTG